LASIALDSGEHEHHAHADKNERHSSTCRLLNVAQNRGLVLWQFAPDGYENQKPDQDKGRNVTGLRDHGSARDGFPEGRIVRANVVPDCQQRQHS
jgi:hypothetical protein